MIKFLIARDDLPASPIRAWDRQCKIIGRVNDMDPMLGIHVITNDKSFDGRMPFLTPTLFLYPDLGPTMQKHWQS